MPIFLEIFALFLLGTCAVVSSPVPSTWGKRAFLFIVGATLWVGAFILVRSQEEILLDFLFSDYALTGPFGARVVATLFVFGAAWFVFIASSVRTERKRPTQFDNLWGTDVSQETVKVFRLWPSILVWVPSLALIAAIWIVPAHFAGVEPTNTPASTPTWTPWSTTTSTATVTPSATLEPTATSEPTATVTPTTTPEPTNPPTQTPDPNKPVLACNGVWLHQEPVLLARSRVLFELCEDRNRLAVHDLDIGWEPIPTSFSQIMTQGVNIVLEIQDGELLVNGQPFAEWLASQGGK